MRDYHLEPLNELQWHVYPDDLGSCFNFKYE
jgi:hypothetical protein